MPVLMIVVCICCITTVNLYSETSQVISDSSEDSSSDELYKNDSYRIVKSKSGLYGVSDLNNIEIISQQWKSIRAVSDDCFIVSKIINNSEVFGMIDREENIIAALAYSEMEPKEKNIILGKPAGSDDVVMIRSDGTLYTSEGWDSIAVSGNDVILSKNRSRYYAKINNDKLDFVSFELIRSVSGMPFTFISDFTQCSENIIYKNVDEVADKSSKYIEAISSDNKSALRDTTSFEYYNDIIADEYLGKSIKNVSDASINIEQSDNGNMIYTAHMKVNYNDAVQTEYENMDSVYETGTVSELSAVFVISFEKISDGSMIINSVSYA